MTVRHNFLVFFLKASWFKPFKRKPCVKRIEVDTLDLSDGNAEVEEAVASGGNFPRNGQSKGLGFLSHGGSPSYSWFISWNIL